MKLVALSRGEEPQMERMAGARDMKLAVVKVPVVKQWSVPLCLGFSSHSYRTVSPRRRTSGVVDEVALILGDGDGRAFVLVGKAERNGARASRSDVTVL